MPGETESLQFLLGAEAQAASMGPRPGMELLTGLEEAMGPGMPWLLSIWNYLGFLFLSFFFLNHSVT